MLRPAPPPPDSAPGFQGRALSRAKSRRNLDFQDVLDKLADLGIAIRVASPKLVMEEVSPRARTQACTWTLENQDVCVSGSGVLQERDGRGEHVPRGRHQQEGHQAEAHRRHQRLTSKQPHGHQSSPADIKANTFSWRPKSDLGSDLSVHSVSGIKYFLISKRLSDIWTGSRGTCLHGNVR